MRLPSVVGCRLAARVDVAPRARSAIALAGLAIALASPASAQFRRATSPVQTPAVSIAAPDDALGVTVNPAAIPYLPGWSLLYLHADADPSLRLAERGDAIAAAIPLPFGFGLGAAVDAIYPTPVAEAAGAMPRTSLSLALAWAQSSAISIGATPRFFFSPDARMAELFSLDLAAAWRPLPYVAFSFLARDVTGPGLHGDPGRVPRSFVLAIAVRPTGAREVTLEVAGAVDDEGRVGLRGVGELTIPMVGRLSAGTEIERVGDERADVRVIGGLALDWGRTGVSGGVLVGDGFGTGPGFYLAARLDEYVRRGIPTGDVVLDLEVASGSSRGILGTALRLDRALRDPRVRGVVLRMRGSGIGLAYAQELRLLIQALADAGKPTLCVLGDASGSELYACTGARSIVVDPAGGVRLYGPAIEITHLGDFLHEVDVRADFVRIGPWKSAIEQYQDRAMSDAARAQREQMLDELYGRMVSDLSRDLGVSEEAVRQIVDEGPYAAAGAQRAGIVDAMADENELDEVLADVFGTSYSLERSPPTEAPQRWGRGARVGVVVIDGEMTDGENLDIPLLEIHTTGGRTALQAIERLASDPAIASIVVRIDSPGGSVLASDQIWRAIRRARRHKHVIASMGAVAASGGYYAASACEEIWADPATITGSIGVWFGKVDFEPLAERFGVHTEILSRGRHAGAESLWRPFTPEERAVLARLVRQWYRDFLRRVASGRDMRVTEVDALARGRIYTGDRALDVGLVDRLGGFHSALQRARQLGGLPDDAGWEVAPSRPSSLLDYVLGEVGLASGGAADTDLERPSAGGGADLGALLETLSPEARDALRATWTLRALESDRPVALLPWTMRAP